MNCNCILTFAQLRVILVSDQKLIICIRGKVIWAF